jgi:hypothetical protein
MDAFSWSNLLSIFESSWSIFLSIFCPFFCRGLDFTFSALVGPRLQVPSMWPTAAQLGGLLGEAYLAPPTSLFWLLLQVVAILAAGHKLPFTVEAVKLDLPELQVSSGLAKAGRSCAGPLTVLQHAVPLHVFDGR